MSSHRATNRHVDKPVDTANIRQPRADSALVETGLAQPAYPDGVRLANRRRREIPVPNHEAVAALHKAAAEAGIGLAPDIPRAGVTREATPGAISRITRNDVELFFDAAHAFRTSLAGTLPAIADRLGKFILAEPYTIIDSAGHPVQTVPDASAMTPAQAKLAGLILHRLLPPLTDMDIEGRLGPGKGSHVDARQVRITVNTVTGAADEGRSTDTRLREAAGGPSGTRHPNAARQIAPITMNLKQVVDQAQELVGQIDGIDPQVIPDTLPGEEDPYQKYAGVSGDPTGDAGTSEEDITDGRHDPPHAEDAGRD